MNAENPTVRNRITVGLIKKADEALDELSSDTGLSKSDLVNRALQLYKFIEDEKAKGNTIWVHTPDDKAAQVHFV